MRKHLVTDFFLRPLTDLDHHKVIDQCGQDPNQVDDRHLNDRPKQTAKIRIGLP